MKLPSAILQSQIADHILSEARSRLQGKALACALNAERFLKNAEKIADFCGATSFFCATHATEESVACIITAAKDYGYKEEAKRINLRDHNHKIVVAVYVQMIAEISENMGIMINLNENDHRLYFKENANGSIESHPNILCLQNFSFNPDDTCPNGDAAYFHLLEKFSDENEMIRRIKKEAKIRNDAIYAGKNGVPHMKNEILKIQLWKHTQLSLGMIWAAVDLSYQNHKGGEFARQFLNAAVKVCDQFDSKNCPEINCPLSI